MKSLSKRKSKKEIVVGRLLRSITNAELTGQELKEVLSLFLYSIGSSLEPNPPSTSEEILFLYSQKPTFARALMAQALMMEEAWNIKK